MERWRRPTVMGVVNVTPDSFSDGGAYDSPEQAAEAVRLMLAAGAAVVDVGGESTRPGAEPVSRDDELRRVLPVLELLGGLPVSVDTSRAEVARRSLALGAVMVNDVTALRREPDVAGVVADAGADLCLMHMQGEPRTMQAAPHYEDVVSEVASFLEERLAYAVAAGVPEERICLDPGIGFGKTPDQNLELVRRLDRIVRAGPCSWGSRGSRRSPVSRAGLARGWRPTRRRSGPRSPPSTGAHRSFASTTSACTSRRSR